MPKKYDAATQERAVRMLREQEGEYASVTAGVCRGGLTRPLSTFGPGLVICRARSWSPTRRV